MRKCSTFIILLSAISSLTIAAPSLTVRERLQAALKRSTELQSKAVAADPQVLKSLALVPRDSRHWQDEPDKTWGAVFPAVNQVKEYAVARPAAMLYVPLRYSRLSYAGDRIRLPIAAPLRFSLSDAPELRRLLADTDPATRSLAVESLAALEQIADIPGIAALIDDPAPGAPSLEFNQQLTAQYVEGARVGDDASSPVIDLSWRTKTVGDYASRAVCFLTGTPHDYMAGGKLGAKAFAAWWATHSDAKQCLWYWQRHISLALRKAEALEGDSEKQRIGKLTAELKKQSPEVEAKVQLLAIWDEDPLNGHGISAPILNLRVKPERLLELLEEKNPWPDVDWNTSYSTLMERIALNTRILRRTDVPRLRAVYADNKNVALLIRISRLLPAAKPSDLDNPETRDGTLRAGIKTEKDNWPQGRLAAELVDVGLPENWPFLKSAFFAETSTDCCIPNLREQIIDALGQQPLTGAKKTALVDLVTDDRFRILWTQYNSQMGDDRYREGAIRSINAHAGKTLITDQEEQALTAPATSEKTLADVLAKAKSLR